MHLPLVVLQNSHYIELTGELALMGGGSYIQHGLILRRLRPHSVIVLPENYLLEDYTQDVPTAAIRTEQVMGLARQRLDEDLHAAGEAQHQVKGRLLLDIVVRQGAVVLEMLAPQDVPTTAKEMLHGLHALPGRFR